MACVNVSNKQFNIIILIFCRILLLKLTNCYIDWHLHNFNCFLSIEVYRYSPIYAILDIRDFAIRYFLNLPVRRENCSDWIHHMSLTQLIYRV